MKEKYIKEFIEKEQIQNRIMIQRAMNLKNQKGITLLVLVVTIIILLILVGITIGTLTGDNGIIQKAGKAKEETEIANEKEILEKAVVQAMGNNKYGNIEESELQEQLDKETGEGKTEATDIGDEFEVVFTDSNRYYTVDKDGNVTQIKDIIEDKYPGDITVGVDGKDLLGDATNPYEIWCIEDLVAFSNMSNGKGIRLENGVPVKIETGEANNFSGKYIVLKTSLNFKSKLSYQDSERTDFGDINGNTEDGNTLMNEMTTGTGFCPIGNNRSFNGTFDGKENEIKNIYQNTSEYIGLFGVSAGNIIKNIGITGYMKTTIDTYAGGLISYANHTSTVSCENCYTDITIIADNADMVGGLIGRGGKINLKNCYNLGNITADKANIGGIIGYTLTTNINSCYNTGNITGENSGGIVGYSASADSTISCCYNQATIDNNGLGTVRAGGIVGYGQGTIDQCFNMGTITSGTTNTTTSFAGGITGENGTISNCYNKGKVTAQASSNVITDSKNYAKESVDDNDPLYSGLGYMNSGLTDNRYYSVYVEDYIDNSYNKGSICNAYAGGISGKNNSSLNCCLNLGDISGGYKETKYTVHYLIGATSMQASYYYADYYQTCIEEIVRYVNPISNGGSYTNCYSNKNLDSYDNDLYNCNYKIIAQSIKITPKDAIVNNDFDWMYAARNNKFTLFDCQAWSFHTPNRNNHPVVTKTKSYSNENSCNFQQDVDTYFYCTSLGGERVRDYGMRDCKISISNPDIKDYRYINIDFLYNRTDIVFEDKSAPRPETDFAKIELFNGGGNQSVPVPYDRNQNYDGNKLSVSLINNFAIKPTYPTILSSTTSLPPNFKTSIWAVSALINNNNPYLKCFFWQSNAATSFG